MVLSATYGKGNSPGEYAALIAMTTSGWEDIFRQKSLQLIEHLTPITLSYGTIANATTNPTIANQCIVIQCTINYEGYLIGAEDTSGVSFVSLSHLSSSEWTTETHIRTKYVPCGVLFGTQGYPVVPLISEMVAPTESPNYYQGVYTLLDKSIAETVSSWVPSVFPHLPIEDSREASEEEAWAAYKEIEPHIHNVLNLLADS